MMRSMVLVCAAGCASSSTAVTTAQTLPAATVWTDPDGWFEVEVPGTMKPREVQEITGWGTVNFNVYGLDSEQYAFRAASFAYLQLKDFPMDAKAELEHSAGKGIARMEGTVESVKEIEVSGIRGLETRFALSPDGHRGHGIQRMLMGDPPRRYHAFCIAPDEVDFAPCEAFVRSLAPTPH